MNEIIVAIATSGATLIGTIITVIANSKLTNYKIDELQKKVEKHNNVIERTALLEQSNKAMWRSIDEIKSEVEKIKEAEK